MKGYKAFRPDWTCRGKRYAVGETATQDGELEMCENGIHFCTVLADCFNYYYADPKNKLAEVEALGEILRSDKDSKCCTDKLKIVREISIAELLKDRDFCLKVVKRKPNQVRFMEGQDQEVFLAAVKQNGLALQYVPDDMKTPKFCLEAIRQNGWALKYVPEKCKTPQLCMEAVQNDGWSLWHVPDKLKTAEICLAAVQQSGEALKYVPENMITAELCLVAVKQNEYVFQLVPKKLRTPELFSAAIGKIQ